MVVGLIHFLKSSATDNENSINPQPWVEITKPKIMPIAKSIATYGTVNFATEKIQQINLSYDAVIQKIFAVQGQQVKEKDALLEVRPSSTANLSYKNAKINLDFAQKELLRLKKLLTQYLATNVEVLTAQQNLDKAKAEFNLVNIPTATEVITAKNAGSVLTVNAQPGQLISAGTILLTMANQGEKQIRLGVESSDISLVHMGQQVIMRPVQNYRGDFTGTIHSIGGEVDSATGLIDVLVIVKNAGLLLPGTMLRGEILLGPVKPKLVVPHSAVLYENNRPYLFLDQANRAEKRYVTIGEDNGDWVSITSGLKSNEWVVTVGNYELENGMHLEMGQP